MTVTNTTLVAAAEVRYLLTEAPGDGFEVCDS